jgi:hypothetical protein
MTDNNYDQNQSFNKLIDHMIKSNQDNTNVLNSLSDSLHKFSDMEEELINAHNEIRNISTSLKIIIAVISIMFTTTILLYELSQSNFKADIIEGVSIKIEKVIDTHVDKFIQDVNKHDK